MLDPNERYVYREALVPPDGYLFGEAVATTYSMDLTTLLSVPLTLVLPHLNATKLTADNTIAVLQAARQAASQLTIFCDPAGIAAPPPGLLYSQLESAIVPVRVPHGGSLHAKLWLIRFDAPGEEGEPWMRLVILSRNLTDDRSWDVSVMLDGDLGAKRRVNQPLVQLLDVLQRGALRPLTESAQARVARLSDQLSRTEWELPTGFDKLDFHALGIGSKPRSWVPAESDRLVVISPFVTDTALQRLHESTSEPVALISRAEELDQCDPEMLRRFEHLYVLDANAIGGDGDDSTPGAETRHLRGLHAKAYVAKRGWDTHLNLGSGNATHSALVAGRNIEVIVELSGRTSKVPGKGIEGLLSSAGLGALLVRYEPPPNPAHIDPALEQAEQALRVAAQTLAQCQLNLQFESRGAEYVPSLRVPAPIGLEGIAHARAWLVTCDASNARSIEGLMRGEPVALASCAPAVATALVAFELATESPALNRQFVLNLPVRGLPLDRDAQVLAAIVKNRKQLMQYILSLLQALDPFVRAGLDAGSHDLHAVGANGEFGAGLLEYLVRTKARHPARLGDVHAMLRQLMSTPEGREIVSPQLAHLWVTVTGEVLT